MRAALGLIALLWALYLLVFALTDIHRGLLNITIWACCNAIPQALLLLPLANQLAPRLAGAARLPGFARAAGAILVYALVSYGAVVFLLALTARVDRAGVYVNFFSGLALVWQLFQGIAYGAAAVLAGLWLHERRRADRLAAVQSAQATGRKPAAPGQAGAPRWLVKTADGIVSIDPSELIRIEADGEYCHLVMAERRHLSRIAIGECAARLDRQGFLRVHRSHLVNSDRLVGAEAAGNGRLQLTLANGDQVVTSRQGAKLVRSAAV